MDKLEPVVAMDRLEDTMVAQKTITVAKTVGGGARVLDEAIRIGVAAGAGALRDERADRGTVPEGVRPWRCPHAPPKRRSAVASERAGMRALERALVK